MIDTTSHAGAWQDAIPYSPSIKVSDFTEAYARQLLEAELEAGIALQRAIRTGYSLAQGRK